MNDDDDPTAGPADGGNEADRFPCISRVGSATSPNNNLGQPPPHANTASDAGAREA